VTPVVLLLNDTTIMWDGNRLDTNIHVQ
jgi:hypothetical protein